MMDEDELTKEIIITGPNAAESVQERRRVDGTVDEGYQEQDMQGERADRVLG